MQPMLRWVASMQPQLDMLPSETQGMKENPTGPARDTALASSSYQTPDLWVTASPAHPPTPTRLAPFTFLEPTRGLCEPG